MNLIKLEFMVWSLWDHEWLRPWTMWFQKKQGPVSLAAVLLSHCGPFVYDPSVLLRPDNYIQYAPTLVLPRHGASILRPAFFFAMARLSWYGPFVLLRPVCLTEVVLFISHIAIDSQRSCRPYAFPALVGAMQVPRLAWTSSSWSGTTYVALAGSERRELLQFSWVAEATLTNEHSERSLWDRPR
jgi:hypothetical protein